MRACIVRRAYKFHERATHSVRDVCGNGFIAATSNAAQIPVIIVCGSCVKPALCAFANYTIKKHTLTNGVKILLPPHIRLTPPTRPAIFAEQLSRFTVLPRQKQHTQKKNNTNSSHRDYNNANARVFLVHARQLCRNYIVYTTSGTSAPPNLYEARKFRRRCDNVAIVHIHIHMCPELWPTLFNMHANSTSCGGARENPHDERA